MKIDRALFDSVVSTGWPIQTLLQIFSFNLKAQVFRNLTGNILIHKILAVIESLTESHQIVVDDMLAVVSGDRVVVLHDTQSVEALVLGFHDLSNCVVADALLEYLPCELFVLRMEHSRTLFDSFLVGRSGAVEACPDFVALTIGVGEEI